MKSIKLSHMVIYLTVLLSATNDYRSAVLSFNHRERILKKRDNGLHTSTPDPTRANRANSEKRKMSGVLLTLGKTHNGRRLTKKKGLYTQIENISSDDEQIAPEQGDGHDEISVVDQSEGSEQMKNELENDDDHKKLKKTEKWTVMMKKHGLNEWQGQCLMVQTHLETLPTYDPVKDGWSQHLKSIIGKGRVDFVGKRPVTNRQIMMTLVEDIYEHKRHQIHGFLMDERKKKLDSVIKTLEERMLVIGEDCNSEVSPITKKDLLLYALEKIMEGKKLFEKKERPREENQTITTCFANYSAQLYGEEITGLKIKLHEFFKMDFVVTTDTIMKIAENPWINFETKKFNYDLFSLMNNPTATMPVETLYEFEDDENFNKFLNDEEDKIKKIDNFIKEVIATNEEDFENLNSSSSILRLQYESDLGKTRKKSFMHGHKKSVFMSDREDEDDSLADVDIVYEDLTENSQEFSPFPLLDGGLKEEKNFEKWQSIGQIDKPLDEEENMSLSSSMYYEEVDQQNGHERSNLKAKVKEKVLDDVSDLSTSENLPDGRDGFMGIFTDELGPVKMEKVRDLDEDIAHIEALREITAHKKKGFIAYAKNRLSGMWKNLGRRGFDSVNSESPVSSEEIESLMGSQLQHYIDELDSISDVSVHYDDDSQELSNFKVPVEISKYLPATMKEIDQNDGKVYFKKYPEDTTEDRKMRKHYYPIYKRIRRKIIKKRRLEDPTYFPGKSELVDYEDEDNSQIQHQIELMRVTESTATKAKKVIKKSLGKVNPVHIFRMKKRARITKKLEKILKQEFFHSNTNKDLEYMEFPEEAFKMKVFDLEAAHLFNEHFKDRKEENFVKKMFEKDEIETIFYDPFDPNVPTTLRGHFAFGDGVYSKLPMLLHSTKDLLLDEYLPKVKEYEGYINKYNIQKNIEELILHRHKLHEEQLGDKTNPLDEIQHDLSLGSVALNLDLPQSTHSDHPSRVIAPSTPSATQSHRSPKSSDTIIRNPTLKQNLSTTVDDMEFVTTITHDSVHSTQPDSPLIPINISTSTVIVNPKPSKRKIPQDFDEDELVMQVLEEPIKKGSQEINDSQLFGHVRFEESSDQLDGHNDVDSDPVRAGDGSLSILQPGKSHPIDKATPQTEELVDDVTPILVVKKSNKVQQLAQKLGFNNPLSDLVNFYDNEDDEYFIDQLSPDREVMRFRYDSLRHQENRRYRHIFDKNIDMRRKDLGLKKEMSNETEKELLMLMEQKFETEKDLLGLDTQGLNNKFNLFQNYGFEIRKEMSTGLIAKLKDMKRQYYGDYLAESETPESLENKEVKEKREQLQQLVDYENILKGKIKENESKVKGLKLRLESKIAELKQSGFRERTAELEYLERQLEILQDGSHLETYDIGNIQDQTQSDKIETFFRLKISVYKIKILDRNLFLMDQLKQIKDEEGQLLEDEFNTVSQYKARSKSLLAAQNKSLQKLNTWKLKSGGGLMSRIFGKRRQYSVDSYDRLDDRVKLDIDEVSFDQQAEIQRLKDQIALTKIEVQKWRTEKNLKKLQKENLSEWRQKLDNLISKVKSQKKKSEKVAKKMKNLMISKYESAIDSLKKNHLKRMDVKSYRKLFLKTQNEVADMRKNIKEQKGINDLIRALKQYLSIRDPKSEDPQYEFLISTYELEELEKRYHILGEFMNERFFNNRDNEKFLKEMLIKSGYQSLVKNKLSESDFTRKHDYEIEIRSKLDFQALEEKGYPVPEQSWDSLDRLRTLKPPKKKKYPTFSEVFKEYISRQFANSNFNIFNFFQPTLKYEERPNMDNIHTIRYFWDSQKIHPDLNQFVSFPLSPLYENPLLDIREFSFGDFYVENFDKGEMAGRLRAINTPSGYGVNNLEKTDDNLYKDNMQDQSGKKMLKLIYETVGQSFEESRQWDFQPQIYNYSMGELLQYYNFYNEDYSDVGSVNDPKTLKFIKDGSLEEVFISKTVDLTEETENKLLKRTIRHKDSNFKGKENPDLEDQPILNLIKEDPLSQSINPIQLDEHDFKHDGVHEVINSKNELEPTMINGKLKEQTAFDPNLLFMMSTNSLMWNVNVKSWSFIVGDPKYRFPEHQNLVKYISNTLDHKINTIYKETRDRLELARNILALERVVDIHGGYLLAQSYKQKVEQKKKKDDEQEEVMKPEGHMRCFLDTKLAYQIFTMIKTNVILNETAFIESFLKTLYNLGYAKDAKAFMMLNYSMFATPEYTTSFARKELPDVNDFQQMGVAIERFAMHYSLMINSYKDLTKYAEDNEQKKKKKEIFVNLFYKIKRALLHKIKEKFRQKMQEHRQNIELVIIEFVVEFIVDALSFLDFVPFFESVVKKVVTFIVGKLMQMIIKKLKVPITKGVKKIREIFNKVDDINMHRGFVNSLDFEQLVTNQIDYTILTQRTKFKVGADSINLEEIFYKSASDDKLLYNQMQNLYLFKPTKEVSDDVFNAINVITKEVIPMTRWDGVSPLKAKYGIDIDFRMTTFEDYDGNVYYKNMAKEENKPNFLG